MTPQPADPWLLIVIALMAMPVCIAIVTGLLASRAGRRQQLESQRRQSPEPSGWVARDSEQSPEPADQAPFLQYRDRIR